MTPASDPHPSTTPEHAGTSRGAGDWRSTYSAGLRLLDAFVLVWVVFGTQIVWLGLGDADLYIPGTTIEPVSYWAFSAALVVAWALALELNDTRSYRIYGSGNMEYTRVVSASLRLFGAIAIVAFLLRIDVARGYLLISLPVGILVLCAMRWVSRQWLMAKRRLGEFSAQVLLVGSENSILAVAQELLGNPTAGYRIVGACIPMQDAGGTVPGTRIPIFGNVDDVQSALVVSGADTVAVTSSDQIPPERVRQISWSLRPGAQHLVLAPSIIDVAGPRLETRPVAGLSLIHVETPRFTLGQRFVKRTMDITLAATIVILLSPLLLAIAIGVRVTSPGPVLYHHERVGKDGKPFRMTKFRSMRVDADRELDSLLAAQGTSQTPLFKVKDDPRITPFGKFIRKYSLDEFPQLLTVIGGDMSLVGPRPQIAAEVALYSDAAHRRLLLRPGITGLWQVSGRSTLSWESALRLDLYYVENWSLAGDIFILLRTIRAVATPGASAH